MIGCLAHHEIGGGAILDDVVAQVGEVDLLPDAFGKGAPLVPYLDYLLYRDSEVGRVMLNIGGIANITALPPGATLDQVIAFGKICEINSSR